MVVAHKPYLSYPVTKEWCERVQEALAVKGRGAQAALAKYLKVSSSQLAETLTGKRQTSELVEPIHVYLGWEPPLPPTASLDAGEAIHQVTRMSKNQREFVDDAIAIISGQSGEQAKKALQEMLKAFRATPKND